MVLKSKHLHYYPELDALRTFAVVMVMISHWFPFEVPYMWYGVQVFFCISGFLITSILINSFKKEPRIKKVFYNFIIRRALRLFPLYFAFISLFFLASEFASLKVWQTDFTLYFYTYIPNFLFYQIGLENGGFFSHLWSLGVEEQFYLIWPFFIFFFLKRKFVLLLVALGLFSIIFISINYGNKNVLVLPWANFHTLCAGGILGYLYVVKHKLIDLLIQRNSLIFYSTLLNLLLALVIYELENPLLLFYRELSLGIFVFALVNFTINGTSGYWTYFFKSRIIQRLGIISYGIYLFHMPMPYIVRIIWNKIFVGQDINSWVLISISFVLTIALAQISYEYFEKSFLKLKNRF